MSAATISAVTPYRARGDQCGRYLDDLLDGGHSGSAPSRHRSHVTPSTHRPGSGSLARNLRFEAPERIGADGRVVHALEIETLEGIAQALERERVDALAICLINACANNVHETQAADFFRGEQLRRPLGAVQSQDLFRRPLKPRPEANGLSD